MGVHHTRRVDHDPARKTLSVLHGVPDLTLDVWVDDELTLGGVLCERRGSEPQDDPVAGAPHVARPDWPDARGEARVNEVDGHRQVVVDLDAAR